MQPLYVLGLGGNRRPHRDLHKPCIFKRPVYGLKADKAPDGLKLYDKLAKHGGAGTLVPITGFANAVVSPALEFKTEGFILGTAAKMFIIAGPVIVYGILASVVYGIILFVFNLA